MQLQEQPRERSGDLYDRYATQAFAAIRAVGFDPQRSAIAGIFTVAAPLSDVLGCDTIDPGEVIVIVAYRPPADDTPLHQSATSAKLAADDISARAGSWFHEHVRVLLVTVSQDGQAVWILGGTEAGKRTGS